MSKGLLWDAFRESLKPEARDNHWEWAMRNIYLPKSGAGEPGLWNIDGVEYVKQIMDDLNPDSPVQIVGVQKGVQLIMTTMGDIVGHRFAASGYGSVICAMPSMVLARRHIKTKIDGMIKDSPYLKSRLVESVGRVSGSSTIQKQYTSDNSLFYLSGSNPRDARSISAPFIHVSDLDGFEITEETRKEGNVIDLFWNRANAFPGRKKLYVESTPTIAGNSPIEEFMRSTAIHQYHMPCPNCGHMFPLIWEKFVFQYNPDTYVLESPVMLACPACHPTTGYLISDGDKGDMKKQGRWIPDNPESPYLGYAHGYILPSMLSKWMTWTELGDKFLKARREQKRNNFEPMKTFVNTVLGLPYTDTGEETKANELFNRRERYKAPVPVGVGILTGSVDVQGDRFEILVKGWGLNEESWQIDYHVLICDPAKDESWDELWEFLQRTYKHEYGHDMPIISTFIDSGGHHTQQVYAFCKKHRRDKVYACKGSNLHAQPIVGQPHKVYKKTTYLYYIGADTAKDQIINRLRLLEPGPGYTHFPDTFGREYFKGLLSERVRWEKGKRIWEKPGGARNEPFDLEVYNLACFLNLKIDMVKELSKYQAPTNEEPDTVEQEEAQEKPVRPKYPSLPRPVRGRGWFGR